MYIPWTTFLRLLICLNENEKRQWCLIYFVCKYSEEDCSSRGEVTDVIKYAAVCRITGLASFRPRELTLQSLTHEVRTTEDASPKFAYLVLRNTRRPNVGWPYVLFSLDMSSFWTYKKKSGRDFLIAQNVRDSAVFLIPLPLNFWPLPPAPATCFAPAIFVSTPLNITLLILNIILVHQGGDIYMRCI